jgi:hypothetical protein
MYEVLFWKDGVVDECRKFSTYTEACAFAQMKEMQGYQTIIFGEVYGQNNK